MRRYLVSLADGCERTASVLLSLLMGLMVLTGFYQVTARFVLYEPSPWSEEVLRRAMIWMVAIGLSIGFRHGAHICVDVINRVRAGSVRTLIRWTVFGITLGVLVILTVLGTDMAWRVRFQTFASLEISMTWAYAAIPVGAALSIIALVAQFVAPVDSARMAEEFGGLSCPE